MTLTRDTITSASGNVSGAAILDDLAEKTDFMFNGVPIIPDTIINATNDYTITVDPPLKTGADVEAGMSFYITPNADNTGAVRMRVEDTNPYYDVVKADGSALAAGNWSSLSTYFVVFVDGVFKILSGAGGSSGVSGGGGLVDEQVFLSSGVWNKPENLSSNAEVEVWLWGGGGGGGTGAVSSYNKSSGGGGGHCEVQKFKAVDIPDIIAVTIGAGGAANTAGGTSTFGSLMTAYGGGAGKTPSSTSGNPGGGGGGGSGGTGGDAVANPGAVGGTGAAGGNDGGGGMDGTTAGNTITNPGAGGQGNGGGGGGGGANFQNGVNATGGEGGDSIYGGGGGGGAPNQIGSTMNGGRGGCSVYGGGGGSATNCTDANSGRSLYGGDGATESRAASVPGGGGAGANTAGYRSGAAGKCIVKVRQ